jgi:hypothetical protein
MRDSLIVAVLVRTASLPCERRPAGSPSLLPRKRRFASALQQDAEVIHHEYLPQPQGLLSLAVIALLANMAVSDAATPPGGSLTDASGR